MYPDPTLYGGSFTVETPFKVSFWYVPGGYDYVNARVITTYFKDKETAEHFVKRFAKPPEMASLE